MYIGQFWRSFRTALSGSIYVKAWIADVSLILIFDLIGGGYELVVNTKFLKHELRRVIRGFKHQNSQ